MAFIYRSEIVARKTRKNEFDNTTKNGHMNWTDEDLDKLFQESAKQMKTPYQESFWTEVETLLPEQKQKKRGFGWFFAIGIVLIIGTGALFFKPQTGNQTIQLARVESPVKGKSNHAIQSLKTPVETENVASSTFTETPQTNYFHASKSAPSSKEVLPTSPMLTQQPSSFDTLLLNTTESESSTSSSKEHESVISLNYLKNESWKSPSLVNAYWMQKAPQRKHSMYVQIGSGFSQSYLANQKSQWFPTFNMGAGYQYRKNHLGFSAGLQMTSLLDHNIVVQRTSQVYNFSVIDYVQNMNYRQVYLLELPLSMDFKSQKQTFSIGLAPTYLASTVMHFSQLENGKVSFENKYIGQRIGLNSFGLKPSIGYQLELAKSWQIGVQLNAQVIRQIDNSQLVGALNKMPITGQFTLRKTLTK
jgi:hypothetical protein